MIKKLIDCTVKEVFEWCRENDCEIQLSKDSKWRVQQGDLMHCLIWLEGHDYEIEVPNSKVESQQQQPTKQVQNAVENDAGPYWGNSTSPVA